MTVFSSSLTEGISVYGEIEDASELRGVKEAIGARKASLVLFARVVSVSSSVSSTYRTDCLLGP